MGVSTSSRGGGSGDGPVGGSTEILDAVGDVLLTALNELTDVFVFVKDRDRRFVLVTDPFVRLMGYRSPTQLIGLRDEDISPEYLVHHYRSHDEHVLESGQRMVDLVELVHNIDGSYDWFLTTKVPVRGSRGDAIGLIGITRALVTRDKSVARLIPLTPAVELISTSYSKQITVADMASSVSMSPSNFSRHFRSHFGTTPYRYLREVRMMAVCDLLSTTELALSTVAARTGFYDQSHLSNEFSRRWGLTPTAYRARYGTDAANGHVVRMTVSSAARHP